jgi:hypothetical protein
MAIENVVFSKVVVSGKKKYYLDVKVAKNSSKYLSIREVTEGDTPEARESKKINVFDNAMPLFAKAFGDIEQQMLSKNAV